MTQQLLIIIGVFKTATTDDDTDRAAASPADQVPLSFNKSAVAEKAKPEITVDRTKKQRGRKSSSDAPAKNSSPATDADTGESARLYCQSALSNCFTTPTSPRTPFHNVCGLQS